MDIRMMRDQVYHAYPGDKWHKKVHNMPDNQIVAVYFRLYQKGRIK